MQNDLAAPSLSVTVLNYCYGHYIRSSLESILSQSFVDFELIVIDDCSTDDSADLIRPYLSDPRVRFIEHEQNQGFVASLMEGVRESRGRYITVISADDVVLDREAFERQVRLLESDHNTSFCYAGWQYIDQRGVGINAVDPWPVDHIWSGEDEFREFCTRFYVLHTGTLIRRSAYEAVGGYDTSIVYTLDNTLWSVLCSAGSVAYATGPLYGYRTHGANMSHSEVATRTTIDEFVRLIDLGFNSLPDGLTKSDRGLRRRARQAALASVATMQIFGGNSISGWRALAYAASLSPSETLFQRRVLALIGRTILGKRGFSFIRSAMAA
jgi:glycosyltransferase involved in cell wall biosynthesis